MEARAEIAAAAALVIAVLAPAGARAQPAPPAGEAGRAEARRIHEEGRRHYELTEYDQAIEAFRQAYELDPFPGFLFDAAQAHRLRARRGDCAVAERLYRNYLRLAPDAPHRDEIAKLADEMAACARAEEAARPAVARSSAAPSAAVVAAPAPTPTGRKRPRAALVVAGSGAAVALGGLGLFLWSRSEASQLEDACAPACDPDRVETPRLAERIGIGALAVGGAAALAGAGWWWLAPAPHGLAIGGRF